MAIDPEAFFDEVQGAAVLKHGILRRYLALFTGKVGSTAKDNRVFYLDAYAGPGLYDDGSSGSPALALATAKQLAEHRDLVGIYVEKHEENLAKLEAFLADTDHSHHVLAGDIEENFDRVLELVGDAPLIGFFDPFGLAVPIDQLRALFERPKVDGSQYHPTTELIIHVSYTGIGRVCGSISSKKTEGKWPKQRDSLIARANARLGGDWWQAFALERSDDWKERIAYGYAKRLHDLLGVGWFRVPVTDHPDRKPSYELLLLTRYSKEAHWHFHEQLSLAEQDFRAFIARTTPATQQTLPLDEELWVATIKNNIRDLLRTSGEFVVRDSWSKVYGKTIGLARCKHVRKAIKQLFAEGYTTCNGKKDGKKDLPDLRITLGSKAP